jgi:hypothetical protein
LIIVLLFIDSKALNSDLFVQNAKIDNRLRRAGFRARRGFQSTELELDLGGTLSTHFGFFSSRPEPKASRN